MKKIQKDLEVSNVDYESTAARKPHSDRSIKGSIHKFLGEFDNDPRKTIRSIARNMSEFLSRLVAYENICYFSYRLWTKMRKRSCRKAFQQTQAPLTTEHALVFFQMRKIFCQVQMLNSQNNCWLALSPQDGLIMMKTKNPVHIMVFGVVTSSGNDMSEFIFLHSLRVNIGLKSCPEVIVLLGPSGWSLEDIMAGNRTQKQENLVLTIWKFLGSHHSNIWPSNFPECNPLDHVWSVVEWKTKETLWTPKMNRRQGWCSIYQFKQGDNRKSLQEISKLSWGRG